MNAFDNPKIPQSIQNQLLLPTTSINTHDLTKILNKKKKI